MTRPPRREPPFDARLVRAVASVLAPGVAVPADPLHGTNPDDFAYLARYWHVAPRLWMKLRQRTDVPAVLLEQVRTEYWQNVRTNARLRAAAADLFTVLNARGIVPMLLKGGCQLFDPPTGHAGTRFMVDLDVLAPPGQDRASFEALCQVGFVPDADGERPHHWPRLSRPFPGLDDGLAVEIHRTPWFEGGAAETDALFTASLPLEGVEGHARLPCAAHRLLNNVVHAFPAESQFSYYAVSEPDDFDEAVGCTDLRQLLDFADLCCFRGGELDWAALSTEADRFGHRHELRQWSFLARELFAVPLPDGMAEWHVDRRISRTLGARGRRLAKASLRQAALLGPARRLKARWLT